ncbi:MAG: hypothetical protein QNK37_27300 [Acidobacteriota bacterium]|nr:hypothetical protein [Acidobacteriota bacterium]
MKRIALFCAALLIGGQAFTQDTKIWAEIGFQTVDLTGNEDMYNTQLRADDGMLLRNLSLIHIGSEEEPGFLDRLQITAHGFGGNPHGNFSLKANGVGSWRFRLDYRRFEQFSALPGLANPFLEDGIIPGQHTYDRTRQMLDAELKLLTDGKWRPVIGYRWNNYDGPGRTTYRLGVDEFLLDSDLDETDSEFRLGLEFHGDTVQAEIMQGWRSFDGTENNRLLDGQGNNTAPYLGEDIVLDDFNAVRNTDADTPTTTAVLRAGLTDKVELLANFIHADAELEADDSETYSGRLADYIVRRFFNGGSQSTRARTEAPSWRGNLRVEADLSADFELSFGFTRHHRELDGNALLTTLYLDSVTFGGGNPGDVERLIDADTHMEKEGDEISVQLSTSAVQNFTFWIQAVQANEETTLDQDIAQMSTDGGHEGTYERENERLVLGAAWRKDDTRISLEYFSDDADRAVVRTDYLERTTTRLRIRSRLMEKLTVSGNASRRDSENDTSGIMLETDSFDMGLDLALAVSENLSIYAGYGVFDFESNLLYRDPYFQPQTSFHKEDGDSQDLGFFWTVKKFELNAGYTAYDNEGAVDYELNRWHARASIAITDNLRGAVEAAFREYLETNLPEADYEADRYSFSLSWKP